MIDGLYIVRCMANEFIMMCKIYLFKDFAQKLQKLLLADTLYNFNCCVFEGLELQCNAPVPHCSP